MENKITIPTGEVIAIGKLKVFQTKIFTHSIPTLSFIVAKKEGVYTASCLQLLLDASGKSDKEAVESLQNVCKDFLYTIFENNKDSAWTQLHELFTTDCINDFWNAYRHYQLNIYETGGNTESNIVNTLAKKVEELQKQIAEYEESKEEINVDVVAYEKVA